MQSRARLPQWTTMGRKRRSVLAGTPWALDELTYVNKFKSITAQETNPSGIFFSADGTRMYTIGLTADTIFQYILTTAWDVSTAAYNSVFVNISGHDTLPQGVVFKPDGTKLYLIGQSSDAVYQYDLSTAWDLSTANYALKSASVAGEDGSPRGVQFKDDGTKMYVMGSANGRVYQYSLSTAWDVSTASYDSVSFVVSTQATAGGELGFKTDGTKMYILDEISNNIYQYDLSTAWDLSTASYDTLSFSVATQETSPKGFFWRPNGTIVYVVGSANDTVYQYEV